MNIMKEIIDKLLLNKETLDIDLLPLSNYTEAMESLGYTYEYESNGWQVDFWLEFTKPLLPSITISGSLFYGNYRVYLTK